MQPIRRDYTLAPSDMTYLFAECPCCYYRKVKLGIARPSTPMPSIFTRMDSQQKRYFVGRDTTDLSPTLPAGIIGSGRKVRSASISVPGHTACCIISGCVDSILSFTEGTVGIADFKTAQPKPQFVEFYGRQLHAYLLACEQPAAGPALAVTRLGLACFQPTEMVAMGNGAYGFRADPTWVEIPWADDEFLAFLATVLDILEADTPPPPASECGWCRYRQAA